MVSRGGSADGHVQRLPQDKLARFVLGARAGAHRDFESHAKPNQSEPPPRFHRRLAAEAGLIEVQLICLDMTGVCAIGFRMTKSLDDDDRDGLI